MTAIDIFQGYSVTPDDPYTDAAEIIPDDDTDLSHVSRGVLIYGPVNTSTPIKVTMQGGGTVRLFLSCGTIHRLRVSRIHATDTGLSAGQSIVALW